MAKRKEIGLIYSYNENWIGGTYYISNLIRALQRVEEIRKPHIHIISNTREEYDQLVEATGYPYTSYLEMPKKLSFSKRGINKFSRRLLGKPLFELGLRVRFPVFPISYVDRLFKRSSRVIYWIPDFQEHYLSKMFPPEDIKARVDWQRAISGEKGYVLFSSEDAKSDFNRLYPGAVVTQFVVPFAVSHPEYKHLDLCALKGKYDIEGDYFFSPNQFWAHKNHLLILTAVRILKDQGNEIKVVFSGKEFDYRAPDYTQMLKSYIKEQDIEENVRFVGFIDRKEQLKLMQGSIAVIQPSRCEGWSTVVEDAKAMGQYVLASNLAVHKEQLTENAAFFDPDDAAGLASLLLATARMRPEISHTDYTRQVTGFADLFLKMVDSVH